MLLLFRFRLQQVGEVECAVLVFHDMYDRFVDHELADLNAARKERKESELEAQALQSCKEVVLCNRFPFESLQLFRGLVVGDLHSRHFDAGDDGEKADIDPIDGHVPVERAFHLAGDHFLVHQEHDNDACGDDEEHQDPEQDPGPLEQSLHDKTLLYFVCVLADTIPPIARSCLEEACAEMRAKSLTGRGGGRRSRSGCPGMRTLWRSGAPSPGWPSGLPGSDGRSCRSLRPYRPGPRGLSPLQSCRFPRHEPARATLRSGAAPGHRRRGGASFRPHGGCRACGSFRFLRRRSAGSSWPRRTGRRTFRVCRRPLRPSPRGACR